jgi:hypothetical protein
MSNSSSLLISLVEASERGREGLGYNPFIKTNIYLAKFGNDERLHRISHHLSGVFFRVITELTGKCTAQEEKIHQVRKEKLIFFAFKMFLVISFVYFRSVVHFFVLQLELLCKQGRFVVRRRCSISIRNGAITVD